MFGELVCCCGGGGGNRFSFFNFRGGERSENNSESSCISTTMQEASLRLSTMSPKRKRFALKVECFMIVLFIVLKKSSSRNCHVLVGFLAMVSDFLQHLNKS